MQAHEALTKEGVRTRVVSMPCWELFEKQDQAYRDSVLPPDILARVSVEQAATLGWERYVGMQRHDHRDAQFRRLGTDQGAAGEVRLHGREGRGRRPRAARPHARAAPGR